MRGLISEIMTCARTCFGGPVSYGDSDPKGPGGGCRKKDCGGSLMTRAFRALGFRGWNGRVVPELRGFPEAWRLAQWMRLIDRSISWREGKRLASIVIKHNDAGDFEACWKAVEQIVSRLVEAGAPFNGHLLNPSTVVQFGGARTIVTREKIEGTLAA